MESFSGFDCIQIFNLYLVSRRWQFCGSWLLWFYVWVYRPMRMTYAASIGSALVDVPTMKSYAGGSLSTSSLHSPLGLFTRYTKYIFICNQIHWCSCSQNQYTYSGIVIIFWYSNNIYNNIKSGIWWLVGELGSSSFRHGRFSI